jgi:hypothetical protein
VERKVNEHLSTALDLSDADVSTLLARVRKAALELAQQKMPNVLASMPGK